MKSKRPVNLDITTIKLPLPAYTSILHRVSGVLLFIGFGVLLYGLEMSLDSEASFNALKDTMISPLVKFPVWIVLSALIYHFVAGVKHLLMDVDIGDGKASGKTGAVLTIIISTVLILSAGVWLW
ncbi:succinate dehydrogenase, cytochrome b556 subunit [Endozoicomonas sp. (ex Bugula neritina AB1)]|nr:succinate dehydrogenase, cytochrome b556 subunit [Endozoicomonas sp. (ex Bugula neritina AB1)]